MMIKRINSNLQPSKVQETLPGFKDVMWRGLKCLFTMFGPKYGSCPLIYHSLWGMEMGFAWVKPSSWRCSPCFCPPFILFSFFFYSSLSLVGWLVVWLAKLGEGA